MKGGPFYQNILTVKVKSNNLREKHCWTLSNAIEFYMMTILPCYYPSSIIPSWLVLPLGSTLHLLSSIRIISNFVRDEKLPSSPSGDLITFTLVLLSWYKQLHSTFDLVHATWASRMYISDDRYLYFRWWWNSACFTMRRLSLDHF